MPLGDSITQGIGEFPGAGGYEYRSIGGFRTRLFELAVADGKDITFVGTMSDAPAEVAGKPFPPNHEGHPGWLTHDFKEIIPTPALTFEPHIILVQMGMMDMVFKDEGPKAAQHLTDVVAKIYTHRPQALIVIATLPDAFVAVDARNAFNAAVKRLAENPTDRVILANIGDLNLGSPLYPTQNDYRLIAEFWYDAIKPYL